MGKHLLFCLVYEPCNCLNIITESRKTYNKQPQDGYFLDQYKLF